MTTNRKPLPHSSFVIWHSSFFVLSLLLTLCSGCRLFKTAAEAPGQTVRAITPGKKNQHTLDPVEVQQRVLRFADQFSTRITVATAQLRHGTNAIDPAEVLRWKIALGTETCSIASGPNAVADLLDLTVFVTVTRASVEEHWLPEVFGESARPLLESCRNAETEIWRLAGGVLNPEQQAELRQGIGLWRAQNPLPENLLAARALGLTARVAEARKTDKPASSASVFNLLMLDPLSGLDPATREIAETRLFAERALYVAQWMPMLLRWQTELLTLNAVALPEVQQLVTNSTQIAASVDRFARVVELLPNQVSAERQEILKALESQEKGLSALTAEARQTLTAGTQMSTSLNTTLTTFDGLMQRFGVGETNAASSPSTNSQPFRILDYAQTATQMEAMARQVTELLRTLDQTLGSTNLEKLTAQMNPVVQRAQTGSKEIVDYAFWKGILLVAIALMAALLYRLVGSRLHRAPRSEPKLL